MPRLLASPTLRADREQLRPGEVQLPAHLRALVEQERKAAYDEGFRAGSAAAAARRLSEVEEATYALRDAVTEQSAVVQELRRTHDADLLATASAIAEYVLDSVDTTAVDDVIARITVAVEAIDDVDVTAHVAPDQVEAITEALTGLPVDVVADDHVDAGHARVVGRWSVAELSGRSRWDAVRELIDAS